MIANTKTLTNLNNYYKFYNGDPLSFNGMYLSCVDTGSSLCGDDDIWTNSVMPLSREKLAQLVLQAEQAVETELGTPVGLKWIREEIILPKITRFNQSVFNMTFRTGKKFVKRFGQQKLEKILSDVSVLFADKDETDNFAETGTITATLPENTDICDIKLFFPGTNYEINGFDILDYNTTTRVITIQINIWNLVKPELYLSRSFLRNSPALDACDDSNFTSLVDIWVDTVDVCKPMIEFVYSDKTNCTPTCVDTKSPGCAIMLDSCNGLFKVSPQIYDEEGCVVSGNNICDIPYKMIVYYQAGCHSDVCINGCNDDCFCTELEDIVFKIATARYPAPLCDCKCVQSTMMSMAQETSLFVKNEGRALRYPSWMMNEAMFGTRVGEVEAAIQLLAVKEKFCNFND